MSCEKSLVLITKRAYMCILGYFSIFNFDVLNSTLSKELEFLFNPSTSKNATNQNSRKIPNFTFESIL